MPIPALGLFGLLWLVPLTASSADPVTVLVNYGGLVGAFALVIIGRLHTSGEVGALQERINALERSLKERDDTLLAKDSLLQALVQAMSMKVVPGMAQTSTILEAIPTQESALAGLLREALDKVETLTARLDVQGADKGGES